MKSTTLCSNSKKTEYEMTNLAAYALYVKYCDSVGVPPATYGNWIMSESNDYRSYESANRPVVVPRADALLHRNVGSRSSAFGLWSSDDNPDD